MEARRFAEREARREQALRDVSAAVQQVAPRFPAVRRVYLFGSVTRPGAMDAVSDVDVAADDRLSAEDYFAFWKALEQSAPAWPIDFVDLGDDAQFAALVREWGILVYEHADAAAESAD
jgi:predicted nucleotidyltransferase